MDAVAEFIDCFEMIETLRRVTGKKARIEDVSVDEPQFAPFISVIGRDAWVSFRQHADLLLPRDIALSQRGYSKPAMFEDYIKRDAQFRALLGFRLPD